MADSDALEEVPEDPSDQAEDLGTTNPVTVGETPQMVTPVTETVLAVLTSVTDGDIILQPAYQRRAFWDHKKKASLIESIFLGLPLPLIYLAEALTEIDGDEVPIREVVDGQQRLTSIKEFYDGSLTIPEDSIVTEIRGKRFSDLKPGLKAAFKGFKLSTATIPRNARADKFELFKRLNQKSTVLSDQELRNSVHHGAYLDAIKEKAESLKDLLRVSDAEWKRMKDVEYLTRLLAFHRQGYAAFPNKRLNQFLNDEMAYGSAAGQADFDKRIKAITKGLERADSVFGDFRFRPYRIPDSSDGEWGRTVNRALMEAQVLALTDHARYGFKDAGSFEGALRDRRKEIIESIQRLHVYNERFNDSIQRGTTGKPNIDFRFSRFEAAVRAALQSVEAGRRVRFFTLQQKQNLWDALSPEDRKCVECGRALLKIEDTEADHIKPFAEGGETIEPNGQLLHRACNRAKGARWDPVKDEEVQPA